MGAEDHVPTPIGKIDMAQIRCSCDWSTDFCVTFRDAWKAYRSHWAAYGGLEFGPEAQATPAEQITIAIRIEGNEFVPDQNGCSAW
jgi:hypothetical protein